MSLSQIMGHERPLAVIRGAIQHGNIGNAYLFFGSEGVGKRTAALEFAKALLCREGEEVSCDICDSCRHAGAGTHPDLTLVAPEKRAVKIEQVRKIQAFLALTSSWGSWKVALLDHAESMTLQAANAMLVTLEEPPSGAVIILISSNLGGLPPTVISRCQKVGFGLLSDDQVEGVLRQKGWTAEDAREAAALAEGSPGRALTLDSDSWKKTRTGLERLMEALASGDVGAALAFVEGRVETREEADFALRILLGWFRREVRRRLGLTELSKDGLPACMERLDLEILERLLGRLLETHRLIGGNVNVKLALGAVFLDWMGELCHREDAKDAKENLKERALL